MKKILPLILSIIAIPWILCSCYASVNKTTENNTASADASANAANPTVYIDEENAIFVDAGKGNDTSGDGSRNAPFKSISRAMEEGAPGKTIYLARKKNECTPWMGNLSKRNL